MRYSYLILTLGLSLSAHAADLLAGTSGTAIPVNTWTLLSPGGYGHRSVGWEKLLPIPGGRACMWAMYREISSERNHAWVCYDFLTNRWEVAAIGSKFDDANLSDGGHAVAGIGIDSTTLTAYGACCFSGSQQASSVHGTYLFDFNGQVGRVKQTATGINVSNQQMGGVFDPLHHKMVIHGGTSFAGTSEYDVATNSWTNGVVCTNNASGCPNASVLQAAMDYDSADGKIYLFGGQASGVLQNGVFAYDPVVQTWVDKSPSGTPPSARQEAVFIYMKSSNKFLMYGGGDDSITNLHNDTWIYDPMANSWTQLSPAASPATATSTPFERGVYLAEYDVVILDTLGGSAPGTYAFRYQAGAGAGALYPSPTYTASSGSINRNTDAWARSPSLSVSGTTVYDAHAEFGGKAATGDASYTYPYSRQTVSGTPTNLGSAYNSMSSTGPVEVEDVATAIVGGTLWACWQEGNGTYADRLFMKSWSGSSWTGGGLVATPGSGIWHGQCSIADVGGVPYVAFRQTDYAFSIARSYVVVYKWISGSTFSQVGSYLNRDGVGAISGGNPQTVAGPPSIVSNGTQPCVAWAEGTNTTASNAMTTTAPQVYASCWNGSSWAAQGGYANLNTANRAAAVSATYMGSQLYVAFTERTATGPARLYVRTWNGSAWSTVGTTSCTANCLNRDMVNGWTYRPELTNDGTNLWITWDESGNTQSWAPTYSVLPAGFGTIATRPQVYVMKWPGSGGWAKVGGTLNRDPVFGAAEHPSIALLSGNPVVAWGEVKYGTLRQIYTATWTGTDWNFAGPTNVVGGAFSGGRLTIGGGVRR
jgi:hypothetical protein